MSESKINIPNFSYPFKEVNKEEEYYKKLSEKETHGNYLFSKDGFWHGGIHFSDSLTDVKATQGIRAIADGELVAYRINSKYLQNDDEEKDLEGLYSNGFFLLRHYFEYPIGNKLTFFSLYMHTAKLSDYDFSTHKMLKKDTIRSVEKYVDSSTGAIEDLEKDTKLTLGELNEYGRYQIVQVDGQKRIGICTVDKGSVIPIEDVLSLKTININTSTDTIIIPSTPIKIKAGEVIGLVGEYNRSKQINRKLLHLEVFVSDKIKFTKFVDNAKKEYEKDISKDKPKPTQLKIPKGIVRYAKNEKIIYEVTNVKKFTILRKAYDKIGTGYKTKLETNLGTKLQIDETTLKSDRYLVTHINGVDKKSEKYTVHKDYIKKGESEITFVETTLTIENEYIVKLSEIKDKIKDKNNEEYLDTNVNSIEPKLYIKYKDCKEIHPITFDWATIIDESSEDDISIFTNLHKYLLPEVEDYKKEVLKVSSMYEKLFKEIDTNSNGQIEPQELEEAAKNEAIKKIISKFIVKHSSEWDKTINVPNNIKQILEEHKDNIKNYVKIKDHLENEEKRVDKLAFFEECKDISDFPASDKVFHFNPIGLVGEFGKSCVCLTMDKFAQIFPSALEEKRKEVLEVFNKYCQAFEINTPLRIAHFFAQVKEEVGETINFKNENLNYSIEALKSGNPFSYFASHNDKAELYGRGNGHSADQKMIANLAYADENRDARHKLGNTQTNDGWNFRGKGFIQLTGRTNYENANNEIQSKVPNSTVNIITDPESILTIEGAMVSSMAYWTMNNLNSKADRAGWDREKVDSITDTVNSGTPSREDRKEHFDLIQNILNP